MINVSVLNELKEMATSSQVLEKSTELKFVKNYRNEQEENGNHKVNTVRKIDMRLQNTLKIMVYHKQQSFSRTSAQE